MISFEKFIKEDTHVFDRWKEALSKNSMLAAAVELLKDMEQHKPDSQSLIVGGAIRSLILNKKIEDVDIATNIDMSELQQWYDTSDIGKSKDFGIVVVHWKGYKFEVANFRSDIY